MKLQNLINSLNEKNFTGILTIKKGKSAWNYRKNEGNYSSWKTLEFDQDKNAKGFFKLSNININMEVISVDKKNVPNHFQLECVKPEADKKKAPKKTEAKPRKLKYDYPADCTSPDVRKKFRAEQRKLAKEAEAEKAKKNDKKKK